MNNTIRQRLTVWALILGCVVCGCTRNNGDIGSKFGLWKLAAMTVDGAPNPDYEGNIFWGFQSGSLTFTTAEYTNGIPANLNTPGHLVFAGWSEADGYIIVDTDFRDDQGTYRYTPPAVLMLPEQTAGIRLKILSEESRKMELEQITAEGTRIVYSLRKWS